MKPNRRMNGDKGQCPGPEALAERGSISAVASGLLLAGLILPLAASNLPACVFDQPRSLKPRVQIDRAKADHVTADPGPRSRRVTDQEPRRNG